jgi:hypothetical protein
MNLLQCYDEGRDELIAIGDRYGLRVIHPDWKGGYDYLAGISMPCFSYNFFNGIWPPCFLYFHKVACVARSIQRQGKNWLYLNH